MTKKDFNKFIRKFHKSQEKLLITKGHDYTQGSDDRLLNFKEVAQLTGMTPIQVWGIYWLKHVFAICTYIKFGKVSSEAIEGRFLDEANYNLLGLALIDESSKTRKSSKKITKAHLSKLQKKQAKRSN